MTRPVTVQFFKNPDTVHWGFEARWLGVDEWGDWMAVPDGSRRWKGENDVSPSTGDAVFCAPYDGWWHLHYSGTTHPTYSLFVDIVTPPVWVSEGRYEMVDLDLDVAVYRDGTVEVQDEDEFEIHQRQYGYSAEMIRGAREETRRIVTALERRQEPFFDVAAAWLSRVTGR